MTLGHTHKCFSVMLLILFLLLLQHVFYSEINTHGPVLHFMVYLLFYPHFCHIFHTRIFIEFEYCITSWPTFICVHHRIQLQCIKARIEF
jgi:hypothetical protein